MSDRDSGPPTELYIVLSDLCNFSCSHCLNSSGPKSVKYRMTSDDVLSVARYINESLSIQKIHFSGGEPTLHLNLIEDIQKSVERPMRYAITTNAWLGRTPEKLFQRIKLDEVIVSYDKFHSPFVDVGVIANFIDRALEKDIRVTLSWVYEHLSEIADAKPLLKTGVKFHPARLIKSGRQEQTPGSEFAAQSQILKGTCPSFERERPHSKSRYGFRGVDRRRVVVPWHSMTWARESLSFRRSVLPPTNSRHE